MCPATKRRLKEVDGHLESEDDSELRYPLVDGIPILINEANSIFTIEEFLAERNTTLDLKQSKTKKLLKAMIPRIGVNVKAKRNYRELATKLPKDARILVVGGSIQGKGMDPIYSKDSFEIVGSDVSFGPLTHLICDAHDIPFVDETFDCVIIQAVLEHVLDPPRCVSEVHRVLKSNGIVYAETPFMQQVHMKQFDFTRFTYLGHRRLFRYFEEIKSGPNCGPGMALAWSYTYFLRSLFSNRTVSKAMTVFAAFTAFFLKYFDYALIDKPGSYDAASGYFFLGRKSDACLADRELIQQFKGFR